MNTLSIIIDVVLILISLGLILVVLMQQGQREGLGAIAGGAETFFGKSKASTLDKKLSKLTTIVAIVFTLLVLVSYLMQDTTNYNSYFNGSNLTSGETTGETDHVHEDGETHSDDETTADSETTAGEDTTADTEAAAETETEAAAE